MTPDQFEKYAALGAKGVGAGALAAWLGFVVFTRPVSSGGIDPTLHLALSAASLVPFAMISAAHFWFGHQLTVGRDVVRG